MTRLLFGVMLLALGTGLCGLILSSDSSAAPATHGVSVGEDPATGKGFFQPSPLTIVTGDTVEWSFAGQVVHSVTSDSALFDSGYMPPGSTFSFTFTDPGTYAYYCALHGAPGGIGHSGSVIVLDPPTSTPTDMPTLTPTATTTPQPSSTVGATRTVGPPRSPVATATPGDGRCLRHWQKWQIIRGIVRGWGARAGSWHYSGYFDLDGDGIIGPRDLRIAVRLPVCRRS